MKFVSCLILLGLINVHQSLDNTAYSYDYYEGIEKSAESNKPIFLLFTGRTCESNLLFNELISEDDELIQLLGQEYVPVVLYVDDSTPLDQEKVVIRDGRKIVLRTRGNQWANIEISKYKHNVQPFMLVIDADENILKEPIIGKITKDELLQYLSK